MSAPQTRAEMVARLADENERERLGPPSPQTWDSGATCPQCGAMRQASGGEEMEKYGEGTISLLPCPNGCAGNTDAPTSAEMRLSEERLSEQERGGWVLTLNKYQRDNLLWLLNACGFPYTEGVPPFTLANTGDWIGELAWMLAGNAPVTPVTADYGQIVIGPGDRPNITADELRDRLKRQFRRGTPQEEPGDGRVTRALGVIASIRDWMPRWSGRRMYSDDQVEHWLKLIETALLAPDRDGEAPRGGE